MPDGVVVYEYRVGPSIYRTTQPASGAQVTVDAEGRTTWTGISSTSDDAKTAPRSGEAVVSEVDVLMDLGIDRAEALKLFGCDDRVKRPELECS